MIRYLYIACSIASLALVVANSFFGVEIFEASARTELPASVRQTPGGYRTYIYWNSGYQGGK